MKKKTVISLLCMFLLFIVAGCSDSQVNSSAEKVVKQTAKQVSTSESTKSGVKAAATKGNNSNTPANSTGGNDAKPEAGQMSQELMGQVTKISGSNITLVTVNRPEKNTTPPPDQNNQPNDRTANPKGPTPPDAKSPQLSGETITINVPSTAKIVSGGRDKSEIIAIEDIKVGVMLEVFYKDGQSGTVESIGVMGTPPGNTQG